MSAVRLYKKCNQAVQFKRKCSQAVQDEGQPLCTRRSAARLYNECSQAVQEEVQPGCSIELPFYNKSEKSKRKVPF